MEQTSTTIDEAFDIGTWVGRKQAFALVAGRCSAADAEILIEIREKKLFRETEETGDIPSLPEEDHAGQAERLFRAAFSVPLLAAFTFNRRCFSIHLPPGSCPASRTSRASQKARRLGPADVSAIHRLRRRLVVMNAQDNALDIRYVTRYGRKRLGQYGTRG